MFSVNMPSLRSESRIYDFADGNYTLLNDFYASVCWDSYLVGKDLDEMVALFYDIIFAGFEKCIPYKKGIFPKLWKNSYIIPIFKSGQHDKIENYRYVCNQSAIPKLLDSLVSSEIQWASSQSISCQQHGFYPKIRNV